MVYRVIGLMSGSSLDGLDIAYVHLHETAGKWSYEIIKADCYPYSSEWMAKLTGATSLNARDYLLLHTAYGQYIGQLVNRFIADNGLQYQVQLIASHGHTTFHLPAQKTTGQLGDGAAIAAVTGINTVTDLRAMDMALGGQGAPIVPIGEKILLGDYDFFLNLGGIANISLNHPTKYTAFDICPANRVLNMLAAKEGKEYDEGGKMAASGKVNDELLKKLNALEYYAEPYPKSLANDFGTDVVYPIVEAAGLSTADALRTYVEHIVVQISNAVKELRTDSAEAKLLATGGGALNDLVVQRLRDALQNVSVEIPGKDLVQYKEALIMALI
ncbi:MAG TPA: anhydro-N-acetylmuramic acid kinase, partial [Ferruginibacter sp.]|nr:anhydro-N-acetylmuramic acid kinase [Ferruginibacter sp.]